MRAGLVDQAQRRRRSRYTIPFARVVDGEGSFTTRGTIKDGVVRADNFHLEARVQYRKLGCHNGSHRRRCERTFGSRTAAQQGSRPVTRPIVWYHRSVDRDVVFGAAAGEDLRILGRHTFFVRAPNPESV